MDLIKTKQGGKKIVYRLNKSLYGLMLDLWYNTLDILVVFHLYLEIE